MAHSHNGSARHRRPFLDAFTTYLIELFHMGTEAMLTPNANTEGRARFLLDVQSSVEACIFNLLTEVPLPPPGHADVLITVGEATITLRRPPPGALPSLIDPSAVQLVCQLLSPQNLLKVFGCLLGESKIVVHASRPALLAPVALAFASFMYPLQWSSVFIPFLPAVFKINDFAQAPVPFIVGVTTSNFASLTELDEIVEVNLNSNSVHIPKHLKSDVRLPKGFFRKACTKLTSLTKVCGFWRFHTALLLTFSPIAEVFCTEAGASQLRPRPGTHLRLWNATLRTLCFRTSCVCEEPRLPSWRRAAGVFVLLHIQHRQVHGLHHEDGRRRRPHVRLGCLCRVTHKGYAGWCSTLRLHAAMLFLTPRVCVCMCRVARRAWFERKPSIISCHGWWRTLMTPVLKYVLGDCSHCSRLLTHASAWPSWSTTPP